MYPEDSLSMILGRQTERRRDAQMFALARRGGLTRRHGRWLLSSARPDSIAPSISSDDASLRR